MGFGGLAGEGDLAVHRVRGRQPARGIGQLAQQVDPAPRAVHRRVVLAGVAAAALGALQRGPGHALADQQHVPQVEGEVPAGVELPVALDARPPRPYPQIRRASPAPAPSRPRGG